MDITDIIFHFSLAFGEKTEINSIVKGFVETNHININEDEMNEIVSYIIDFRQYLKTI
jgi:hypothetical protein